MTSNVPSVPVRIAAIIGHSDEFALLDACIRHHERLGISAFYVSVDAEAVGSQRKLLDRLARRPDVRIRYREESESDVFDFLGSAVTATVEWTAPEWILVIDSDEFCACPAGDLRRAPELPDADILTLRRFNVPLRRGDHRNPFPIGPREYGRIPLIVRPLPVDLSNHSETMWPPWILNGIAPKTLFRPVAVEGIGLGGHRVVSRDAASRAHVATTICVMHLPFTTFERFRRKAERIRDKLDDFGFRGDQGLHWKRWAAIAARGGLRAEFAQQAFDPQTFAALVADGTITDVERYLAQTTAAPT
jgi:hypothetical protein